MHPSKVHTSFGPQAWPQAPQFFGSELKFVQKPGHSSGMAALLQLLQPTPDETALQYWFSRHALPQSLQLFESCRTSTHTPPQSLKFTMLVFAGQSCTVLH